DEVNGRKSALADLAEWMLLAVLVGILDYATGPFISLTLFYLVPVAGAAWFAGQRAGFLVAVTAAAAAVTSDMLVQTPVTGGTFLWNSLSRLVLLSIAAAVVSRLRAERDRLERLDSQRSHSLALLDRGLAEPARQILELVEHWNGGINELRTMLRPRAETIAFLARDFAEVVISANDVRQPGERTDEDPEKVALTVELARQLFAPQGGTLDVSHNPLTRSLRVTARFPLA